MPHAFVKSPWLKHGFLNTVEHGLTRVADAFTTLLLLWVLQPEVFSRLASAQAYVAPLLLLFICPETILYRDYGRWKQEGLEVIAARLEAFRRFAYLKALVAFALSVGLALASGPGSGLGASWSDRFFSFLWAFSLVVMPHLCGPDREFLRLHLLLKELNLVSLFQKATLLGGVTLVSVVVPGQVAWLALVALLSVIATFFLARSRSLRALPRVVVSLAESGQVVSRAVRGFSFWQHLLGVILGWVQSMDVFFLGILGLPARTVGLYAAVLKLANFTTALPVAFSNLFSVWIGRRGSDQGEAGETRERRELVRFSMLMLVVAVAQAAVLILLAPWFLGLLSHGRWTEGEQLQMRSWLAWILGGSVLFSSAFAWSSWLAVRASARGLLFRVFLPWGGVSLLLYGGAVKWGGADAAAMANVAVSAAFISLLSLYSGRKRGEAREEK